MINHEGLLHQASLLLALQLPAQRRCVLLGIIGYRIRRVKVTEFE